MLTIRKMEEKDLLLLYGVLSDGEVMRYIEPPFSLSKTKRLLKEAGMSESPLIYAAEDENGSFVGYVIYHDYESDSKEIGWVLRREEWGKSYAQELTAQLIEKAAAERKSVVIKCSPEQEITKRIAAKFGFAYVGRSGGCDVFKLTCG